MLLTIIGGIGASLAIAWQDFRARWIHVGWVIFLALCGLLYTGMHPQIQWVPDSLGNLFFAATLMIITVLIFKSRGHQQVLNTLLGWGDVWMLLAMCLWFPLDIFLVFYVGSTLWALGFVLIARLLKWKRIQAAIPLAGLWGIALSGWLLYQLIGH